MDPAEHPPIQLIVPPWKLKGTVYSFMMYSTSKDASILAQDPYFMFSELEASSSFATGVFLGGIGMVQIIRYTESPVGPYDEMLIVPGFFEYQKKSMDKLGVEKMEKKKNARITRIYVSKKETCNNGRTNWNIPKHLAQFTFDALPDKRTLITVQPLDDGTGEILNSNAPFFSATFKSIPYLPSFPASTKIARYVGVDMNLVQPPLPEGKSAHRELPGTDRWCSIMPYEYSRRTSVGWWDMRQRKILDEVFEAPSEEGEREGKFYEHWWPGIGRWRIGMVMEDADLGFPEGEYWTIPNL